MANFPVNNLAYFLQGDGVSTTAQINLGFSPISATFVQALVTNTGVNITSNVSGVVVTNQFANVTFNSPFTGIITIILDVLPVLPLLSGSVQVSTPWVENLVQIGGNNVVTGTGASGLGIPRVTVSNDSAIKVWDGTNVANVTAKGTQGAEALTVQEMKDSGRTYLSFVLDAGAAPTTEALASMAVNKGGTTTAAQTTYTVTAGKTLRLQSITANLISSSGSQTIKLRIRSAATVLATSSIVWADVGTGSSGVSNPISANWPDGIEIAAGQQIGLSLLSGNASNSCTFALNGYEY